TPVVTASTKDAIAFLQKENISIYAAALQNATNYNVESFTNATAIAVGTEATGLSKPWRDAATKIIQIPMQGKIDSMNVSVAAAILIFEAKRQRNFTQ
ncbi:MAG: RNA methyltransferase, partial [Flavobacteriaceae bacterium]|nr:RNA methyltransferase [Flavobacteriaceae bacterium]